MYLDIRGVEEWRVREVTQSELARQDQRRMTGAVCRRIGEGDRGWHKGRERVRNDVRSSGTADNRLSAHSLRESPRPVPPQTIHRARTV